MSAPLFDMYEVAALTFIVDQGVMKFSPSSFCRPSVFRQVTDFANVFKAFIGTNWIGLPFAFKQSGIVVRRILLLIDRYM